MRHRLGLALSMLLLSLFLPAVAGASGPDCDSRAAPSCVDAGVVSDQQAGQFHGLIMVPGMPGVLDGAAHAGTQPGCGDCEWTLLIACLSNNPDHPHEQNACTGAGDSRPCEPGQVLYRLFLTTATERNRLAQTLCLGPTQHVVAVGDQAAADVKRYLDDVVPPDLVVDVQPPHGVLADLPAYFRLRPPAGLHPRQFGGDQVTEAITITPAHYRWHWGDSSPDLRTDDAGGSYPDGGVTHTYATAGRVHGSVTTQWSATYTVTVAGAGTFGPYDATGGTISRTQPFTLTVDSARSHLVSH